ncbi:MAG TPA: hypothetical protein VFP60_14520 [Pseudolabrys sp.]|nr:hypothetical protein [Pseudolabrys sp.]
MMFPRDVRTNGSGIRHVIRNTQDALRFIEEELPGELKCQPRWTFARDLLLVAERTEKRRDLNCAYRQLQQALRNDLLLDDMMVEG